MRVVLLNALPFNAFTFNTFTLHVTRITLQQATELIGRAQVVENYIRHEGTLKLLSAVTGIQLTVNSGLYQYRTGDVIVVITLKKPVRGQEVAEVSPEDLDVFKVTVH
jgi:hypothetical protein